MTSISLAGNVICATLYVQHLRWPENYLIWKKRRVTEVGEEDWENEPICVRVYAYVGYSMYEAY